MNNWWTQLNSKVKNCDFLFCLWKRQNTKLAATLGLRPFGLSSATIRDEQDLNTENNNVNDSEETAAVEREIEESKRFFSRFPPVAHHNMVQYSHLGKIIQHLMAVFKNCTLVTSSVIALCLSTYQVWIWLKTLKNCFKSFFVDAKAYISSKYASNT